MPRRLLEEVGGYDTWMTANEDWDVFCSLAERGHTGTVIPEHLFQYRLRPDSLTRTTLVNDRYAVVGSMPVCLHSWSNLMSFWRPRFFSAGVSLTTCAADAAPVPDFEKDPRQARPRDLWARAFSRQD